ncbi:MAG: hypothetical protein N4A33_07595 [Bacteriovoracaceae bacterium]|nr:hypothetical protein [Bacteriovoracaceae bacterium]
MKKLLLCVLPMLLFISCGANKEETSEDNFYSQSVGGNCGLDVVSDYNSMALQCRSMYSTSDVDECENKIIQLMDKYPGIDCKAERGYGLDKEEFYITESNLQSLLEEVQNL